MAKNFNILRERMSSERRARTENRVDQTLKRMALHECKPILLAEIYGQRGNMRLTRAWCPYCAAWHYHTGEGPRVAHCTNEASPFRDTDYILQFRKDV